MNNSTLYRQIKQLDKVFHAFWRGILFGSTKASSGKLKSLGFIDMQLLEIAGRRPDAILKEIREYLGIPQTTLSSVIARLEKQGLLKRVINPRDMRSFSLEVTREGKRIIDDHKKNDHKMAEDILLILDENERVEFLRLMEKISVRMGKSFL